MLWLNSNLFCRNRNFVHMTDYKATSNTKNLISKVVFMIVNILATMVVTSLVVKKLGNIANGYNQMANDFVSYVAILSIALNSMASRFITMSYYKNDNDEINKYYNSVLYGNLVFAAVSAFLFVIITLNLNNIISIPSTMIIDVKLLFAIMFANFVVNLCFTPYSVATFIKNRIDLDSFRNIEGILIKTAIVVFSFYLFEPKIWYVSLGILAATVYCAFRNVHYTHVLVPEVTLFQKKYFDWECIKQLLSSGMWNSFTSIGAMFLCGLDLIIANQFISHAAMGILSVSKILPKFVFVGMANIASVFTPGVMIEYAKKDKNAMVRVMNISIKLNSLLSIIIEVGVIVFSARLYMLWLPSQDAYLLQKLSAVAILGYIVLMPFEVLWMAFTATNKVRISSIYLFVEAVITISVVIGSMYFVHDDITKIFIVASTSSLMELIRGFIFLPFVSAKILDIPTITFYKPLVKVFFAFVISLFVSISLNNFIQTNNWFIFISLAVSSAICTMATCSVVLFNREERKNIISSMKEKIKNG